MLNSTEIRAQVQQYTFEFLQIDLGFCLMLCDLAQHRKSPQADSSQVLIKGEEGYATISELLRQLEIPAQRNEIARGLHKLRGRLDRFQSYIQSQGNPGNQSHSNT